MSKIEKLITRINSNPKDFTWDELVKILSYYGFEQERSGKTSGSGVKFMQAKTKRKFTMHKPHPGKIVKPYVIRAVLELLKNGEMK